MKNLIQRTITGVLFVAAVTGCILYHPLSFGILFAVIIALTIYEFASLVNQKEDISINPFFNMIGGSYLFFAIMGYCRSYSAEVFIPYLILWIYIIVRELYLKQSNPVNNWAYSFMSQLYIALPFALLNVLAFHIDMEQSQILYEPIIPLSVFIFIWINDSGAYCIGSLCGRHRLFKRISPKKSWEGSIGGGVFAIITALIMAHFYPFISVPVWIGFALVVVIFGTWGDLVESLFKRQLGIKDSGNILPGHGGWLDRFDSALIAIPAVVVYLYTIQLF